MVRKAQSKDAEAIFRLIDSYASQGQMLYRPWKEIVDHIDDFLVYEREGQITGTCSLKCGWDQLVEIRSLGVHPNFYRRGFATHIVRECVEYAQKHHDAEGIFVLTYAVPLFLKLGFETIPKSALPLKVWEDCMGCTHRENCDEIAMLRSLKPIENFYLSSIKSVTALV